MAPGIIWVASIMKNRQTLNEDQFNRWYTDVHLDDVLGSGVPDFAMRYKNVAQDRELPYLALYHFPDLDGMQKPEFHEVPTTSDLLGGTNDWRNELVTDIRVYECIQVFEGAKGAGSSRPKGLRTVLMNVDSAHEADFDKWYRQEHLDLVSKCTGFVRATRYKLLDPSAYNDANARKPLAKWLTIYEWETPEFPAEQVQAASQTEWTQKLMPSMSNYEGDSWSYISERHGKDMKDPVPMLT